MDEYDFWYNGKPAAKDLPGITGHVGDIKKGQTRDGGSFLQRSKQLLVVELVLQGERLPGQAVQRLPQRLAHGERIGGLESEGAATAAPSSTKGSGLDLIGLTKVFPGGTVAVDDVDLHVDHGEYVVLLGPSGCGKTTTLRMIGGHEFPTRATSSSTASRSSTSRRTSGRRRRSSSTSRSSRTARCSRTSSSG